VVIGLLISVPIVVWGSTLVLKLVERFPLITYGGAAVLAYTRRQDDRQRAAARRGLRPPSRSATGHLRAVLIAGVLAAGWWTARRAHSAQHSAT
jgi:predicted tellurium resistance membrane protein TerC